MGYVWSLWDQNIALNQIKQDWFVLAWAAKWLDEDEVHYRDQRGRRNLEDDRVILKPLWRMLNEADIVITQNGTKFDAKKLNARFILNGFKPPSSFKHIDTLILAKRHFAFTSNKLEYMSDKLCVKYKKLKHHKFSGFELWRECLNDNLEAWQEMEKYNKHDVLALEELYQKLQPWDSSVNFNLYHSREDHVCQCGHPTFTRDGYAYTTKGKFQRFRCKKRGAMTRSTENLFPKSKRDSLHVKGR